MLGLAFVIVFLVYLLISLWVISYAANSARAQGIAGWKWGVPAAMVMYLIVFWDHVPTVIAHKYYCDKEAGFTVYKTLEQWKKENPGVAETLTYAETSKSEHRNNETIYHLNERFDWHSDRERFFLSLLRWDNQIIDVATGEVLAHYVDFSTGWGNFPVRGDGLRSFKLWLVSKSCSRSADKTKWLANGESFLSYKYKFKRINGEIK